MCCAIPVLEMFDVALGLVWWARGNLLSIVRFTKQVFFTKVE